MFGVFTYVKNALFHKKSPVQVLSRTQTKHKIIDKISPVLEQQGFVLRKGNIFWRVNENKTDVIELRFVNLRDHQKTTVSRRVFSIYFGCYFHYIPDLYDRKSIYVLPNKITPLEEFCHYRNSAKRTVKQKLIDANIWHLDETPEFQKIILDDLAVQVSSEISAKFNLFNDVSKWLVFLESDEPNIGSGTTGSMMRYYLLGFTYIKLNKLKSAKECLIKAKELYEIQRKLIKKHIKINSPGAPLDTQIRIIDDYLHKLNLQNTF